MKNKQMDKYMKWSIWKSENFKFDNTLEKRINT